MRRRGFTLIELMIVVAIIGIIAAVAIPKFCDLVAQSKLKADGWSSAQIKQADAWCSKEGVMFSDFYKDEDMKRRFKRGESSSRTSSETTTAVNAARFCPNCGHQL